MQFSQDENQGKYFIRSYKPGAITINQTLYPHSVILTSDTLIPDWPPQTIDMLTREDLLLVAQQKPEVVLLGTGKKQHFPSAALLSPLIEHNLGFEVMDTAAACRTYNTLVAEGRRVVAALIIT
jgi:uncharacterized protein